MWREVAPFWALTLLGWLASTGTVQIADNMCKSHGVTGLGRAVAIMGASLFAYGVVWIVKFVVFNRLVFVDRGPGAPGAESDAVAVLDGPGTAAPAPAPVPTAAAAAAAAPVPTAPAVVAPVVARPAAPAWEGPARAGR
jgi:hypothetical protein